MKQFLLLLVIGLSACTGSWAKTTTVKIDPSQSPGVSGDAYVTLALDCERPARCEGRPGSDITVSLRGLSSKGQYALVLANGTCSRVAVGTAKTVASSDRQDFEAIVRAHVDTKIDILTSRDYLLLVRDRAGRQLGCGKIYDPSLF